MKWRQATPETRLRFIAATILTIGFVSAIVIYLTAKPVPGNPLGYEPEDSKQYIREIEVYGGTANLLASEIRQWLNGLWHGKRLAITVACLTVLLASGFWFVASRLPSDLDEDAPSESKRSGTPS